MQPDYKNIIYNNYHSFHTKKLYGTVTLGSIERQFKFWKYYFSEFLPIDKTAKILDAGCGNGGFVHWLIELGFLNSSGIDISKEMIDLGQSLNIKNIFKDDIFNHLRSNKNKYDIIFCRDVIEHFNKTDVVEIFILFYDSLKSGGKFIIQVPNGYSPSFGKIFYSDFTHEILFSESVLNQLTQSTGYKSLYVKEINPVPHGFISTTRFILWKLLKIKYQFYQLIENGYSRGFFSQNIIAEMRK
jgi:2-polyprenyl-3-methyl-5-hydroxy-6-metoxy-1,4-benzoquinol methylase